MVVLDDCCGFFLLRNVNFGCELEIDVVVVNFWGIFGEERYNNSGFYELVVILDKFYEELKCIDFGYGIKEYGKFFFLLYCI